MGIFTYEIVLQDIPFKKMLRTQNEDFKFQRGYIGTFQRFSGVNDMAEIVSAGSITPRKSINYRLIKKEYTWLFDSKIFVS
jgi:hypothetical protein